MIIETEEIKNYMVMVDNTQVSLAVLVRAFRDKIRSVTMNVRGELI